MTCPARRVFHRARTEGFLCFEDATALLDHLMPLCPECAVEWAVGIRPVPLPQPGRLQGGMDVGFWFTHRDPFPPGELVSRVLAMPRETQGYWLASDARFHTARELLPLLAWLDWAVTEPFTDRLHLARAVLNLVLHLSPEEWPAEELTVFLLSAERAVVDAHLVRGELAAAEHALRRLGRSLTGGDPGGPVLVEVLLSRALLSCLHGAYGTARGELEYAGRLCAQLDEPQLAAGIEVKRAFLALELGELRRSEHHARAALALLGETSEHRLAHQAREILDTLSVPAGGISPFAPGPFTLGRAH